MELMKMAYNQIPRQEESFSRYQVYAYGGEITPILLGEVQSFNAQIKRDKMPVFTLGSKNSVGIVRKGRLCTGMLTSFLANGEDIQRKLIKGYFGNGAIYNFISNSIQYKDIAIDILRQYQAQQNLKETEDLSKYDGTTTRNINTLITGGIDKSVGDAIASNNISGTNANVLKRPPLRLGEIEGLNLMLIGVPEVHYDGVDNKQTGEDTTKPPRQLIVVCEEVHFVGEQINIQIDNPNVIEQVTFYAKDINNYIVDKAVSSSASTDSTATSSSSIS